MAPIRGPGRFGNLNETVDLRWNPSKSREKCLKFEKNRQESKKNPYKSPKIHEKSMKILQNLQKFMKNP